MSNILFIIFYLKDEKIQIFEIFTSPSLNNSKTDSNQTEIKNESIQLKI